MGPNFLWNRWVPFSPLWAYHNPSFILLTKHQIKKAFDLEFHSSSFFIFLTPLEVSYPPATCFYSLSSSFSPLASLLPPLSPLISLSTSFYTSPHSLLSLHLTTPLLLFLKSEKKKNSIFCSNDILIFVLSRVVADKILRRGKWEESG